jgi:hypothetical protein
MKLVILILSLFTASCFGVNLYYYDNDSLDIRVCVNYVPLSSQVTLSVSRKKPAPTSGPSQSNKQSLIQKEKTYTLTFKKQKKS